MVFSSVLFVFFFLPALLFFYFLCPKRILWARNVILLLFSLAFYFYGEPKYIAVLVFSIAMNYAFGLLIYVCRGNNKNGKQLSSAILALTVASNLFMLVYFKYMNFITENVSAIFGANFAFHSVIMPIGISFFTFQAMSYVFDVYRDAAPVQKNPLNVALYVSMFPQLIAGPIVRYETVALEISNREFTIERFSEGLIRFIYGFSKKILIANTMGQIADSVFSLPQTRLSGKLAWIGALAYSFQIYYDFSGYSDMGIGLGRMLGFTFLENFNYPYISKSITEFWRRWHMSLGAWFRDYVYIPLGGNRVGVRRHIFNIIVVWALTGFWHGAAWNFVVWGLYFAVILIIEKYFLMRFFHNCKSPVFHLYSIILIIIGWVIFRSDNLSLAVDFTLKMFSPQSLLENANNGQAYYYIVEYFPQWIAAVLFAMPIGKLFKSAAAKLASRPGCLPLLHSARLVCVFSIFLIALMGLVGSTFNPFIYFRF